MRFGVVFLAGILSFNAFAGSEILWDTWGVPHIQATSETALFQAYGYAQMHSHGNLLLKLYAQGRGRAAEVYGEKYLASDESVWKLGIPELAAKWLGQQDPAFRKNLEAFADGINLYASKHPEQLSDASKRVLPVSATDILSHLARDMATFVGGGGPCASVIAMGDFEKPGSNGWAISPERTTNGHSMLLANPHLPWQGLYLFYESQLEMTGVNLSGATLVGVPVIAIGFNDRLGWTHTVNTFQGCDLYSITPQANGYVLDGATRAFEEKSHAIQVRGADGSMKSVDYAWKRTVHGPLFQLKNGKQVAARIAFLEIGGASGALKQWWDMGRSRSISEFQKALGEMQLPLFNVIYADADGHTELFFAGVVPDRTSFDFAPFFGGAGPGDRSSLLTTKLHGFFDMPFAVDPRGGFLQNSNSPPWWASIPAPYQSTDFPADVSRPGPLSLREQSGLGLILSNPKFDLDSLVAAKFSTHVEMADRVLPELLPALDRNPSALAPKVAEVMREWDRRAEPESRAMLLFFLWQQTMSDQKMKIFRQDFDPAHPLNTPAGVADPDAAAGLMVNLAEGLQATAGTFSPPWGEVARQRAGKVDLPANGGPGDPYGIFRAMSVMPVSDGKMQVVHGDSWMSAIEFSQPVRAKVLLSYGNSTEPGSPHVGDQLILSAKKQMRDAWRTRAEVEAHLEAREKLE